MESNYLIRCPHPNMIECYPGHTRCYTREQKCIYVLRKETKTLLYCRNGQHLQNCNNIECIWKFKCQNSYCIPYQYICDGKWDCWYGQDEFQCDQYTCTGMFKCRYSFACIHIRNICDGMPDCPMEDDELICPKINCIDKCKCLNHGIYCINLNFSYQGTLFNLVDYYKFVNVSNSYIQEITIIMHASTVILISRNNSIEMAMVCKYQYVSMNLRILDLGINRVSNLHKSTFYCLPYLIIFMFKRNKLSRIENLTFKNLSKLVLLDLSTNRITHLSRYGFCGLRSLRFLDLEDNNVLFIGKSLFIDNLKMYVIFTHAIHLCCLCRHVTSICTAKPVWPSGCGALMSNIILKMVSFFTAIFVMFLNFLSITWRGIVWQKTNYRNEYEKFVMLISGCDLIIGFYVFIIVLKDIIDGDNYVQTDSLWRRSILCQLIGFMFMYPVLLVPLFILSVCISRYRVVKDPFQKPFTEATMKLITICIPIVLAVVLLVVTYLRKGIENLPGLSSPLCLLLGNTDQSTIQQIVTLFTAIHLIFIFLIIVVFYFKLLTESRKAITNTLIETKERQKTVMIHIILTGTSNGLCWIPFSLFYLVSSLVNEFSMICHFWIVLVILPFNSLLNPILFNISEIKRTKGKNVLNYLYSVSDTQ